MEEEWKKKTIDRGGWKILSDDTVKSCGSTSPLTKGKGEDREVIPMVTLQAVKQCFTVADVQRHDVTSNFITYYD